ncbi:polyphenol oxidase, chloroplastic-like [Aristolochia californica]|uniref:polyphenol oxidase, chloroplastic-like n=1 Tax=Aristolochia californica TaxID=171875 RepID=UPI0035D9D0AC
MAMLLAPLNSCTTSSSSASFSGCPVKGRPRAPRVTTSIRSSSENGEVRATKVDRRNVLLGLGGLYGATSLGGNQTAMGVPLDYPDLQACHVANYPDEFGGNNPIECCPPYDLSKPVDIQPYVFPTNVPNRTRKAAHLLTQWEKDRFKRAITDMKNLPSNHPWNFLQQARIHCAYCNAAYDQKNSNSPVQVHFSWIFLPWHRYYLYFFERILGKIISDDTFGLPFWCYDVRDGMMFPDMYLDPNSSLYNPNRNRSHFPLPIDLLYAFDKEDLPPSATAVQDNIAYLRRIFTDSAPIPELFMGSALRAGDTPNGRMMSGMLENLHNAVHNWIGQVEPPNLDMGNFFSAARDTMFYAHHVNLDRLWSTYRSLIGNQTEFNDSDWLDARFVFFDENEKVVSVTTRQCLNQKDLGYVYQNVPVEYLSSPQPVTPPATPPQSSFPVSEFGPTPRPLSGTIRAVVGRPRTSPSPSDKRLEAEVLFVDDIELNDPAAARFDVYVNRLSQGSYVAGLGTFAGSFVRVRHNHTNRDGSHIRTLQKFGITSLLEEIGAEADENVVITLVPRDGNLSIGGVHIELMQTIN